MRGTSSFRRVHSVQRSSHTKGGCKLSMFSKCVTQPECGVREPRCGIANDLDFEIRIF